jgi:hypothetical protein
MCVYIYIYINCVYVPIGHDRLISLIVVHLLYKIKILQKETSINRLYEISTIMLSIGGKE